MVAAENLAVTGVANHHYNPDWLSDDALLGNFVARMAEFTFLRDELARDPRLGSAQHYLLVGVRGAGKTTLLKRLAIAIRRDADLGDHLIALSFPEELYQVKNLADFWWAACEALADELDRLNKDEAADRLVAAVAQAKKAPGANADPLSDAGYKCLLQTCAELGLRPVLLVDNLDMVFQRIDKAGRKLKNPHAPAYWALREALSTTSAPIVIGGSVRLSEPFTDYDKAFYDFFIPKRLGKLSFEEVRQVLDHLADAQGVPEVKQRLQDRPSRIEALYELTGGNPRALGLIFELLRQGPNSRAVEDFERLMDITTPYYKARFEDLSEQTQVVMHALAVCRADGEASGLRFGLTAAEIGNHAGLPTGTVSAQLDTQEREGMVEKSSAHGRAQYRIAEQLFRLWLQMRGSRRVRQNVIGLTRFLEAMFSVDELQASMQADQGSNALAESRYSFAVAGADTAPTLRRAMETRGADQLLRHLKDTGESLDEFLNADDLPADLNTMVRLREQLQKCDAGLETSEQNVLLGSMTLSLEQKRSSVQALCTAASAQAEAARLRPLLRHEQQTLLRYGLHAADLKLIYLKRAQGFLPLPNLTPEDTEVACSVASDATKLRSAVWRLVGSRQFVRLGDDTAADKWLDWGRQYVASASSHEWANMAGALRRSGQLSRAKEALDHAFAISETSRAWFERAMMEDQNDPKRTEYAYRKAIELDPSDAWPWNNLGVLLAQNPKRYDDAEHAYRKAIELAPLDAWPWNNLGTLLERKPSRYDEAERAFRKAIELDPLDARNCLDLGALLADKLKRYDNAEQAFRTAIGIDPLDPAPWNSLGILLADNLTRYDEAEHAFRKAIELDPRGLNYWHNLGYLMANKLARYEDAEHAFRKAIDLDPLVASSWNDLGKVLTDGLGRYDDAEHAYHMAIELDPRFAMPWNNLGVMAEDLKRYNDAERAYRKANDADPLYAMSWNNLASLMEQQGRLAEASDAYSKAAELDSEPHPFWQEKCARLRVRLHIESARTALDAGDMQALRKTLDQQSSDMQDRAATSVSEYFVEGLLAPALASPEKAKVLLAILRDLNFAQHARPLLLAFEAATSNRPEMLIELEPEIQRAAQAMFTRLTGKKPSGKMTARRPKQAR